VQEMCKTIVRVVPNPLSTRNIPILGNKLCTLTPDFDPRASGFSPDRADALVWAIADLIGHEPAGPQALLEQARAP
jgi:phage terminase large subunit-like protein